jgi:hypothetical protein
MIDPVYPATVVVGDKMASGLVDIACFPERLVAPHAYSKSKYALADGCTDIIGNISTAALQGEVGSWSCHRPTQSIGERGRVTELPGLSSLDSLCICPRATAKTRANSESVI